MRIGPMRTLITLQKNSPKPDSRNQPIDDWQDAATVWSRMITSGGGEFYAAQKVHAETTAVFSVRYRQGVTPLMRIKHGDRFFEILAVNNVDERDKELQILAREVV